MMACTDWQDAGRIAIPMAAGIFGLIQDENRSLTPTAMGMMFTLLRTGVGHEP